MRLSSLSRSDKLGAFKTPGLELMSQPRFVGLVGLTLLLLGAATEGASAAYSYFNVRFDLDAYQFLEVARGITLTGVGTLSYFPNSTAAVDVVYLTHHFPPYIIAAWSRLFDIQVNELPFFLYGELLLALGITALALGRIMSMAAPLSRGYLLLALGIVVYDPVAHALFFDGKVYLRWSLMFATLAIFFLITWSRSRAGARLNYLAFVAGACASMSVVSFLSLGVPAAFGVTLAFIAEGVVRSRREGRSGLVLATASYLVGAALPLVVFGGYAVAAMDSESVASALKTFGFYGESLVGDGDIIGSLKELGYFYATIIVSPFGPTLLPLGILATAANIRNWRVLGPDQRTLVRVTAAITIGWLILALFGSTHFYAARMTWALPLYVGQIVVLFQHRHTHEKIYYTALLSGLVVLWVQSFHHAIVGRSNLYFYGVSGFIAVVLALAGAYLIFRFATNDSRLLGALRRHERAGLLSIAVLVVGPVLLANAGRLPEHAWNASRQVFDATESPVEEFIQGTQAIAKQELSPGDTVLTNLPLKEMFPDYVSRQAVYFYRGLFGGVSTEPASKVFLFSRDPNAPDIGGYVNIGVGETIYYRGFFYRLERRVPLTKDSFVLVGSPTTEAADADVIYAHGAIPQEEIASYLQWRHSNGLTAQ